MCRWSTATMRASTVEAAIFHTKKKERGMSQGINACAGRTAPPRRRCRMTPFSIRAMHHRSCREGEISPLLSLSIEISAGCRRREGGGLFTLENFMLGKDQWCWRQSRAEQSAALGDLIFVVWRERELLRARCAASSFHLSPFLPIPPSLSFLGSLR